VREFATVASDGAWEARETVGDNVLLVVERVEVDLARLAGSFLFCFLFTGVRSSTFSLAYLGL